MTTLERPIPPSLADEHSVLLWQACAYADDVAEAAHSRRRLIPAYDALLAFLHYGLLPYLADEERDLPPERLRDAHMRQLLMTDHERLRGDIDNVEFSRTRELLTLAAGTLVERLGHHLQREEIWVDEPDREIADDPLRAWALPLLLTDEIDVDALPADHRDRLLCQRLTWLRPGETLHLASSTYLHPLWQRLHACYRDSYVWAYEQSGPVRWRARVRPRSRDGS